MYTQETILEMRLMLAKFATTATDAEMVELFQSFEDIEDNSMTYKSDELCIYHGSAGIIVTASSEQLDRYQRMAKRLGENYARCDIDYDGRIAVMKPKADGKALLLYDNNSRIADVLRKSATNSHHTQDYNHAILNEVDELVLEDTTPAPKVKATQVLPMGIVHNDKLDDDDYLLSSNVLRLAKQLRGKKAV